MTNPIIHVGTAVSHIECERRLLFLLDKELAREVPGAMFARQRAPGWDGMWHPFNVGNGSFPTGLLSRVIKIIPTAIVNDARVRPGVAKLNPNVLSGITLEPLQQEAIKVALEKVNGIIGIGMGGGKTEIGISIAAHVGGLCVWFTHKKDLLRETAERILLRTGQRPALIGDGCWDSIEKNHKFVIVMPQTVQNDMDLFESQVQDATVFVADEVHRTGAANKWFKIAQAVPAYFRIGLTGTPTGLGDEVREMRLEAATGPVLIRRKSSEMADLGRVVPCQVIYHRVVNRMVMPGTDYREARRILIEENPERNAMVVELAIESAKQGKSCLIICDTIKHARLISEVLKGEEIRSRLITGKNNSGYRKEAKRDLKSGALEVIIATTLFDEGIDLPELEVVIIAAGGKSAPRFIQRCGRAIRNSPGKEKATIHDFFDTGSRYLVRHSVARIAACRAEGFEVKGSVVPTQTV